QRRRAFGVRGQGVHVGGAQTQPSTKGCLVRHFGQGIPQPSVVGEAEASEREEESGARLGGASVRPFQASVRVRAVGYLNLKRSDLEFTFLCMIENVRRGIAPAAA
ncbi:MAG: hypothetical protein ONA69_07325, partial [candidate division KSB1 bacterium]|nr:hypothetical protein [candidate division KSB1 bacterium]